MAFQPRHPGQPRTPQSPAQEAARERSFRIFRLRGLHSQCLLLSGDRREAAQAAVDAELVAMGAEAETPRQQRRAEEFHKRWIAEGGPDLTQEIPF